MLCYCIILHCTSGTILLCKSYIFLFVELLLIFPLNCPIPNDSHQFTTSSEMKKVGFKLA